MYAFLQKKLHGKTETRNDTHSITFLIYRPTGTDELSEENLTTSFTKTLCQEMYYSTIK